MTTLIVGLIVFFLISPYPYKPGGQIQILPPTQQLVQAPVSGQIIVVYFNGGDGQWLKAGTVLASMASIELQNDIATLQEQVRDQQAQVEKHQAELRKLKTGPRAEEIDVAQRQIAVAGQEIQEAQKQVEVAQANIDIVQKELEAAEVQLRFSERAVARLDVLHAQGGFALQEIEAAQVINETNRVQVLEAQEQLNQAQKQVESALQGLAIKQRYFESAQAQMVLLRSGASPEDIQAASQEVVSAQAQLKALKQNFNHARDKLKSTNLFMPLDGYLVEGYLKKKQGSFLNQGDTFTTAQDDRVAIAELHLPEYDSGGLAVNSAAQVKLLAYPNTPITGSVITIEPTTTEDPYGRILKVLIRLDNVNQTLKPGMTGYAKISAGEKPLIVLLTRPIVRFIQIEFWSWLP
jgi:multidrug efflux pump subunit AcrA (membrane-fusion protein)